ncbi:MAG: zinc-dependent alcohol dehydrogenase [Chloroflexota bacterium]
MKAVQLTGPRRFEYVDIPDPTPDEGQVVLEIEHVSVCGSDTHLNYEPVLPEEAYPLNPGMPCHEIAGTIVESRDPRYRVGSRAIVLPDRSRAGTLASGGLAEYIASSKVIPIPDHGGTEEWLMCQPSGTVLYATREWGNVAGKRVAVLGQGAIGLSFTMLAELQGARQVIGIDPLEYRLDKARDLGATDVINPGTEESFAAVEELTGGAGVDVVVDASGAPEGLNQAVQLVNRNGLVIGFSLVSATDPISFRHMDWMRKEVRLAATLSGSSVDPTGAIADMVALRERGWIDPARLITHRRGWADIPEAYEMYTDRADNLIKVVMAVKGSSSNNHAASAAAAAAAATSERIAAPRVT